MFTLLLIYSCCFIINPVIAARTLPPLSLIADIHSIQYPHTLSTLSDDGSHGSTLFPPQLLWLPWIHNLSPSMMMSPMATQYVLLDYYGSHGSTLCPNQWWWIPWIHTLSQSFIMVTMAPSIIYLLNYDFSLIINRSLALSLFHPLARRFFFLPLW